MELWKLWNDISRNPFLNMAIDELLLQESALLDIPFLRFYGWDTPSISIGYIQKHSSAEKPGYTVVRRMTGGGMVFHDMDLTYTVAVPQGHRITTMNRQESYRIFHEAIMDALSELNYKSSFVTQDSICKDKLSMKCFSAPVKYDIALIHGNGNAVSKAAGAAQRRTKNGILHQGSILLPEFMDRKNLLKDKLIDSFQLDLGIRFEHYTPEESLIERANALSIEKYCTDAWNKMR